MVTNNNGVVFFGTDDFAVMVLEKLIERSLSVSLVVTTPPRPQGRGRQERKSDVSLFCTSRALRVQEIEDLKAEATKTLLADYKNAVFVVVSYGKIVPEALLSISVRPMINLHPSLLPRWRGASPIQTALLMGDAKTGVSIINVTPEIDAGAILAQKECIIDEAINALELKKILAHEGAMLLADTIALVDANEIVSVEQGPSDVTYTKKFIKEDGMIDWNASNRAIHNKIRALVEWPTAFSSLKGKSVKIFSSMPVAGEETSCTPGEIIQISNDGSIRVMTGSGALDIFDIQGEGKKRMNAYQFTLGARVAVGDRFGGVVC